MNKCRRSGTLGAIAGDIVGSRLEWHNYRAKDFEFFTQECFTTDDSIMTLAAITGGVAQANYGVPEDIRKSALSFLDERQKKILFDFKDRYMSEK